MESENLQDASLTRRVFEAIDAAYKSDMDRCGRLKYAFTQLSDHEKEALAFISNPAQLVAFLCAAAASGERRAAAAEAGAVVQQQEDDSAAKAVELTDPPLLGIPSIENLETFLFAPPRCPVPVLPEMYAKLSQDPACGLLREHFTAHYSEFALALACTIALDAVLQGETEDWTALHVNNTVVRVMSTLETLLPAEKQVGLKMERDAGDSISGMTILSEKLRALRPDGVIRHRDQVRLLLKWEEKGANDLLAAKAELQLRTAVWPEIYYGPLLYLLTFAAAGSEFQFYAVQCAAVSEPTAVGPILRVNTLAGKSKLLFATFQMHRYLYAVSAAMPSTVAPVNKLLKTKKEGITRTVLFLETMVVEKAISPWSLFQRNYRVRFDFLKSVYEVTLGIPNLVHSKPGTPVVNDDTYEVQLEPVGITPVAAIPTSEQQFACAARDGLTALDGLHKQSIVHRDVRGDNFTCNPRKDCYFLLDLELCGRPGVPHFTATHWDHHGTLVNGAYTAASDIHDFGMLLSKWAACLESTEGKSFLALLTKPARDQTMSAEELRGAAVGWLHSVGL